MPQNLKKKLLFVITKSNWGGAQKYVFDLASRLPKDKYEISVALGGDGVLITKLRAERIKVIPIKSLERDVNLGKDLSSFFELIKIIKQERPDIVHLNSSKIGLFGSLAARLLRVPKIIFTAHGWAFNEDRHPAIKFGLKLLSWATAFSAKNIIVLSDKELRQTIDFPLAKNKVAKIYNGISDEKKFSKEEAKKILLNAIQENRKKLFPDLVEGLPYNFLENKTIIGTISELHPNKGLEYAIKAISSLRGLAKSRLCRGSSIQSGQSHNNFVFIIIGDGVEEKKLKNLIKENKLENHVFLAGFIDNAGKLLNGFDIFTLTSLKEGLPYCLLEAGICGLPIVASNVGGIPEIVNSESGILTNPKDIPALTDALKMLIQNPEKRKNIGHNISQQIKTVFNFQKMIEKTGKVYEA